MPAPAPSSPSLDHATGPPPPAPATDPRPPRPSAKALGKRRETFHGTLPGEREGNGGETNGDGEEGKGDGRPKKRVLPYRARRTGMGGLGSSSVDEMVMSHMQQKDEQPLIPENAIFVLTTREKGLPPAEELDLPLPVLTNGASSASTSAAPKPSFKRLNPIDLVGSRLRARAEESEDTSDAAYLARHRKYEATERRQRKREVEKLTHEHYLLKQRMHEYGLMDVAAFGGEDKKRAMLMGAEELDEKYQALLGPRVEKGAKDGAEDLEKSKEDSDVPKPGRGRPRGRLSEPPLHPLFKRAKPTQSRNSSTRSSPQPHPHPSNRVAELRNSAAPSTSGHTAAASPLSDPGTPFTSTPTSTFRLRQTKLTASPSAAAVIRIHGRDSHGRFAPKPTPTKRTASGRLKPGHAAEADDVRPTLPTSRSAPDLRASKGTREAPPQTPVLVRAANRPARVDRNLRRPMAFGVPLGVSGEEVREFEIPGWVDVQYPADEAEEDMDEDEPLHQDDADDEEEDTAAEYWRGRGRGNDLDLEREWYGEAVGTQESDVKEEMDALDDVH